MVLCSGRSQDGYVLNFAGKRDKADGWGNNQDQSVDWCLADETTKNEFNTLVTGEEARKIFLDKKLELAILRRSARVSAHDNLLG